MNESKNRNKRTKAEAAEARKKGEMKLDSKKKNEMDWTDEQAQGLKEHKNMDEKVLYEIRFVETEDGFRLEATGDKKGLRRMGFGPLSMLGAGRRVQHGRGGRAGHRMRRMRARRAAMAGGWGGQGRGPWGHGPAAEPEDDQKPF